jgi:hypothetical protein
MCDAGAQRGHDFESPPVPAAYLSFKTQKRLKALAVLRDEDAHSDVVRETQEVVELALKGVLRAIGVAPPKFLGPELQMVEGA